MITLVSKYLVPKPHRGITLFPFIVLKDSKYKDDVVLMNHERIHIRQQLETLIIPFYIWYGLEFLYHYARLKNKDKAYRQISFEREAFKHESDLNYLKKRTFWGFMKS